MKTQIFTGLLTCLMITSAIAQDSLKKETKLYTGFYNQVPENFSYPLLGMVNSAAGNQQNVQIGLANINQKNLTGGQMGFSNLTGGNTKGMQLGFINASKDSLEGAQLGFVNLNGKSFNGIQAAFVNVSGANGKGAQVGYVNLLAGNLNGTQVGFVNVLKDDLDGAQIGYVNVSGGKTEGVQLGFVNLTKKEALGTQVGFVNVAGKSTNGFQLGFVNVADSFAGGMPLGFVSFVKKGGYRAIELGSSDLFEVQSTFKIGVKPLYTAFGFGYNDGFKHEFSAGIGLGSIVTLSKHWYFNPEAMFYESVEEDQQHFLVMNGMLGYEFKHIAIAVGPTISWTRLEDGELMENQLNKPQFSLYNHELDDRNRIHVGAKAGISFIFN